MVPRSAAWNGKKRLHWVALRTLPQVERTSATLVEAVRVLIEVTGEQADIAAGGLWERSRWMRRGRRSEP
ncbi:hypothetical protein DKM19_21405 [Streptosporangium sp. 'caverna']|nr:hypothetical protein DKM19_21405 [Streptosporangium sp. 'caverna']